MKINPLTSSRNIAASTSVICTELNPEDCAANHITYGKIYKALNPDKTSSDWDALVGITGDKGYDIRVLAHRFGTFEIETGDQVKVSSEMAGPLADCFDTNKTYMVKNLTSDYAELLGDCGYVHDVALRYISLHSLAGISTLPTTTASQSNILVATKKKWIKPSVPPRRSTNGKFAKATPETLKAGSIYRVQERDRHFVARFRDFTIGEHVIVDVLGKPICVPKKKLRLASAEEVETYLSKIKKKKDKEIIQEPAI